MPDHDIALLIAAAAALERSAAAAESDTRSGSFATAQARAQDDRQRAFNTRQRIAGLEVARKRDLSAIHAQAKKAGIDEHTRRLMIQRLSGGRTLSAADLTAGERRALLAELGGGQKPRAGRPAAAAMGRQQGLTKVEALLADAKLPWSYAEAILRRQRGILDPRVACPLAQASAEEIGRVIAALWRRAKRAKAAQSGGDAA